MYGQTCVWGPGLGLQITTGAPHAGLPLRWIAWLHLFFKDHKPAGWSVNISASRQRRLNSIVADATGKIFALRRRGLEPTAKFMAPLCGENWSAALLKLLDEIELRL